MEGLSFYKRVSPYPEDKTLNCRLTIEQIDDNFLNLKNEEVKSVDFDCGTKVLTINKNDGNDPINVDMNCAWEGLSSNFNVELDDSGTNGSAVLNFYWDENGETRKVAIKGLVTKDSIGNYVMKESFTDGTIIGNGTSSNPLGVNPIEATGHYKPVIDLIDLTNSGSLPDKVEYGDRYLTLEKINDYGYLYNIEGLREIEGKLSNGWRIPTKEDWDDMLNAIDDCDDENTHSTTECHTWLGKHAGRKLKSVKGWKEVKVEQIISGASETPHEPTEGTNEYGFSALPAGFASDSDTEIQGFGSTASFWTSTELQDECNDYYVKNLMYNKASVWQSGECPVDYRSLRLIKDYDGSNAKETDFIGGKYYKEVLLPSKKHGKQIWTKTNVDIDVLEKNKLAFDDKFDINSLPTFIINEWNGKSWERKFLTEGSVIVINKAQDKEINGKPFEYGIDTEFMLVGRDLLSTEKMALSSFTKHFEDTVSSLEKKISDEADARVESDNALSGAIDTANEKIENAKGLAHKGGTYILLANNGTSIPSYDGNDENFITIQFDGNFGEIIKE